MDVNKPRLPEIYVDADGHSVLPHCDVRGRFGLGFRAETGLLVRLALTPQAMDSLIAAFEGYRAAGRMGVHRSSSGLMPSESRLVPSEGVNVAPNAAASAAACAVSYEPRDSDFHAGWNRLSDVWQMSMSPASVLKRYTGVMPEVLGLNIGGLKSITRPELINTPGAPPVPTLENAAREAA